jgi:glyoxylase-like metal-dependent hydrolase (beta-lactamase superfamily II)
MKLDFNKSVPVQRTTLGDFELTVLSDGNYWADGGSMFGVVPKALWSRRIEADEHNRIPIGLNSILVRTGKQNVLIETGIGPKLDDRLRPVFEPQERLMRSFEEAGVAPDEIDIVINTHLHFDHCGWNTVRENGRVRATFPRAKYFVQEGELKHAHLQLERDRVSYLTDNYDPLIASGQMQLLRGASEIVPGISVEIFPGHTEHMQAVIIRSAGQTACYISDLIPDINHLDLTWVLSFDLFPLQTIESRRRFYERAVPEEWLVLFTHDVTRPWAKVRALGKGKFEAAS